MLTGSELGAAIARAIDKKGVTKKAFADAMGVRAASVQDWIKYGRIAKSRISDLVAYFSDVETPEYWGLSYTAGHVKAEGAAPLKSEALHDELPIPTEDRFAMVPQLDIAAACGEGRYVDHVVVKGGLAFKRSSLRGFGVPENSARIIYAAGGSMWPTIQDGRVVLLNTAERSPKDGKVYAICTPDGGLVLKRLIWDYHPSMGAQTWIMRSDNPDKTAHPDKILPPDDRTMIIGQAVWNDNVL